MSSEQKVRGLALIGWLVCTGAGAYALNQLVHDAERPACANLTFQSGRLYMLGEDRKEPELQAAALKALEGHCGMSEEQIRGLVASR